MARYKISIPINGKAFKRIIQAKDTLMSLEIPLGVTRQAINNWIRLNRIKPSILCEIVRVLELSPEEVKEIVGGRKQSIDTAISDNEKLRNAIKVFAISLKNIVNILEESANETPTK